MASLKEEFESIRNLTPQVRGRRFEKLLGMAFTQESIRHRLAYRPRGEEVDGALWWNHRTFLLEAKWVANPLPASTVYAFKGKVDGKFDQTLGILISMSGFSEDCVTALAHGKNLNIVLFDDTDVEAIVEGQEFAIVLEDKLFAAGQTGNAYLPWPKLRNTQEVINAVSTTKHSTVEASPGLIVICEGRSDKIVLDSLISHVAKQSGCLAEPKFLISSGKHPLMESMVPSLATLLSNGISGSASLIVVFDADTTDSEQIELQRQRILMNLDKLPPTWKVHVAVAVPEIEAWIGLTDQRGFRAIQQHISTVDWNTLEASNEDVAHLMEFLRDVI